jgi:tetratricopeptide (TPR) repeat protein
LEMGCLREADRARTDSFDAYLALLDGRNAMARYDIAGAKRAIEQLRRAIQLDPKFALAYAELAHALWLQGFLTNDKAEFTDEQGALIEKALSLDHKLGEAYVLRGHRQRTHGAAKPRCAAGSRWHQIVATVTAFWRRW